MTSKRRMIGVPMIGVLVLLGLLCLWAWAAMIRMPGDGKPASLPEPEAAAVERLQAAVQHLSATIGERNLGRPAALTAARDWVRGQLEAAGFEVSAEPVPAFGEEVVNLVVEVPGATESQTRDETVVVGAHYDTMLGTPGADDNASGVAALLELARRFAGRSPARTLRLIAFVNEESPYYREETMGSLVSARAASERGEHIVAMLSLESIGYFDLAPGSQRYPFPLSLFYPSTGDFLAFVSDRSSADLTRRCVEVFREEGTLPSQGAALPASMPGVGWSDHWSYWQIGVPAVMVTGTAPFRNPHYHEPTDTPDRIDGRRLALAVDGLEAVIGDLISN